jgi:predicted P-loop ATPase
LLQLIEAHWGNRLRFKEMSQQIEMDEAGELDIGLIYLRIAEELGRDIAKQTASDLVQAIALKNTYSPVRDYLKSLTDVKPIDLDSLAKRYFGTDDPLHAKFFKNTLVGAVARAFEPGCQVDTTCILYGPQGLLKSRCWQTLASDPWFTDNLSEASEKDEKMKLRHSWILEYSEFESVYKRKEVSQLKSFLTSRFDTFRRPYGRSIEKFPRTSVFVGTTNREEFLSDSTGERRFLVIPVSQRIPIKTVEAERDSIWAAAVAAYKAGEQWWLTPEEDKLLAEANKTWQSSDTWEASILSHLQNKSETTIADILTTVIRLDLAEHKKSEQMRVSDILRCNGWTKARNPKRIDGKLQKYWERVVTGGNGVVTEVVTPQNPCSNSVTSIPLPPVTTFLSKDSPSLRTIAVQTDGGGAQTSKTCNSESEESFETKVVTPPPSTSLSLSDKGFQPVTTSFEQGGNTLPNSLLTGAKQTKLAIGDLVEITQRSSYQGQRGEIVDIGVGAREDDYYVSLENEKVIVIIPRGADSFAYLRKL